MPKIPQMKYTVYLFDFDYTLADSSRGIVTCFRSVLERHGYTGITDDMIKRTIGKTLEESFSILTGITDADQLESFRHIHECKYHSFPGYSPHAYTPEKTGNPYRNHFNQIPIPDTEFPEKSHAG